MGVVMRRPARDPAHRQGNLALGMQESSQPAESHVRLCSIHASRKSPRGTPPWSWEICRDGEPLPARLREDGFKTEYTATAAGKVVLRNFLAGLAEEER
jgi:hypothetical protein